MSSSHLGRDKYFNRRFDYLFPFTGFRVSSSVEETVTEIEFFVFLPSNHLLPDGIMVEEYSRTYKTV